jgi:hypothetical protein
MELEPSIGQQLPEEWFSESSQLPRFGAYLPSQTLPSKRRGLLKSRPVKLLTNVATPFDVRTSIGFVWDPWTPHWTVDSPSSTKKIVGPIATETLMQAPHRNRQSDKSDDWI